MVLKQKFLVHKERSWGGWRLLISRLAPNDQTWYKLGILLLQILCFYAKWKPSKIRFLFLGIGTKSLNFCKQKEVFWSPCSSFLNLFRRQGSASSGIHSVSVMDKKWWEKSWKNAWILSSAKSISSTQCCMMLSSNIRRRVSLLSSEILITRAKRMSQKRSSSSQDLSVRTWGWLWESRIIRLLLGLSICKDMELLQAIPLCEF